MYINHLSIFLSVSFHMSTFTRFSYYSNVYSGHCSFAEIGSNTKIFKFEYNLIHGELTERLAFSWTTLTFSLNKWNQILSANNYISCAQKIWQESIRSLINPRLSAHSWMQKLQSYFAGQWLVYIHILVRLLGLIQVVCTIFIHL